MFVWMRIGDAGEYESFDTPYDAGFELGYLLGIPGIEKNVYWVKSGLGIVDVFEGRNYISLYWGDSDAEYEFDLNRSEKREFLRGLSDGIKERIY